MAEALAIVGGIAAAGQIASSMLKLVQRFTESVEDALNMDESAKSFVDEATAFSMCLDDFAGNAPAYTDPGLTVEERQRKRKHIDIIIRQCNRLNSEMQNVVKELEPLLNPRDSSTLERLLVRMKRFFKKDSTTRFTCKLGATGSIIMIFLENLRYSKYQRMLSDVTLRPPHLDHDGILNILKRIERKFQIQESRSRRLYRILKQVESRLNLESHELRESRVLYRTTRDVRHDLRRTIRQSNLRTTRTILTSTESRSSSPSGSNFPPGDNNPSGGPPGVQSSNLNVAVPDPHIIDSYCPYSENESWGRSTDLSANRPFSHPNVALDRSQEDNGHLEHPGGLPPREQGLASNVSSRAQGVYGARVRDNGVSLEDAFGEWPEEVVEGMSESESESIEDHSRAHRYTNHSLRPYLNGHISVPKTPQHRSTASQERESHSNSSRPQHLTNRSSTLPTRSASRLGSRRRPV